MGISARMARQKKLYIGPRLRRIRRDRGLTQKTMAEDLGVSPSYINLIERNQRPVSAHLLLRFTETYEVGIRELASDEDDRLFEELQEAFTDPIFQDLGIIREDIQDLAAANPTIAEALSTLYRSYRTAHESARDSDALRQASPVDIVRTFIHRASNYFPELDKAAETVAHTLSMRKRDSYAALAERLQNTHKISTRIMPADIMAHALRRFDPHRNELRLSEVLDGSSRNFQLALQIAYLEQSDTFNSIINAAEIKGTQTKRLARAALANYYAAALLMPYEAFLKAAEELSYDIEMLGRRFETSFEQVSHRLTTLCRPGDEGIPFFLIKVDAAGNISKRFCAANLTFARIAGGCPRWSIHDAFRAPRRIFTQLIRTQDGENLFTIARTVHGWNAGFSTKSDTQALALGCAAKDAGALVYASGYDLENDPATEVGAGCAQCDRLDCAERARPPARRRLIVDEYRRGASPFSFALD
ncbi:MAG: short-chain fatty acyl-CoA regulator family protein [Pseudomonadota bacterium]